jgi:hypothetical protein
MEEPTLARRSALRVHEPSKFTIETLQALAKDLSTGRLPLERTTVSDDRVIGLRAMVMKNGNITFHASYHFGDKRPFMLLGQPIDKKADDYVSLEDARELTKTIKYLAEEIGVDPQDGLQKRLIRELKTEGTSWRPDKKTAKK